MYGEVPLLALAHILERCDDLLDEDRCDAREVQVTGAETTASWKGKPTAVFSLVYRRNGVLIDLGSGSGRVVVGASLLRPFRECRGVEVLAGLHEKAAAVLDRLQQARPYTERHCSLQGEAAMTRADAESQRVVVHFADFLEVCCPHPPFPQAPFIVSWRIVSSDICDGRTCLRLEIGSGIHELVVCGLVFSQLTAIARCGEIWFMPRSPRYCVHILPPPQHDWADADLVFANSTCFTPKLMAALEERAKALRPGSVAITLTRQLQSAEDFDCVASGRRTMSWGPAGYYIYRRR